MPEQAVRKFDVVAAGRAFTDVIARVPAGFLEKWDIPRDAGREFDAATMRAIRASLQAPVMAAGGTGANMAATFAALGGRAGFFAKTGRDETGFFFLKDFEERGVALCCDPYIEGGASAVCLVLLTEDGFRSFATSSGCADSFEAGDFRNFDFASTRFFVVDAELLTLSSSSGVLLEAMDFAKGKTRLVVNLHNNRAWPDFPDVARYIAGNADIVIGNADEFASFSEVMALPHSPEQAVVTTHGTDGVTAFHGGASFSVPAHRPERFVSSVGAGDAFMAGFLFGLSNGADIEKSLRCGIRAAVAVLKETGARPAGAVRVMD